MTKNRNRPTTAEEFEHAVNQPTATAEQFGRIDARAVLEKAREAGEMLEHGPMLRGSVLGYTSEGWVLVDVELPASVVARYATKVHEPNLKGILVQRAADRLERTPRTFGAPKPEGEG